MTVAGRTGTLLLLFAAIALALWPFFASGYQVQLVATALVSARLVSKRILDEQVHVVE